MAQVTEYAVNASGTSWTNPTNANADDAADATYVIASKNTTGNENTLSNFGFDSSIPAGSVINSVMLEVEHFVSTTGGIAHLESAVAINGTTGTFNTDSAEPTTPTQRQYADLARPGGGAWTRADLLDGTFTVRLRARSGNNATSVTYSWDYARVVVDYTPPPVLSNQTVINITSGGGQGRVDTDTGNGTMYWVVVADGDSPSVTQIKNGQNSSGGAALASGNQAVSATGQQTMSSFSGLSPSTAYDIWFVHTNSGGGDSSAVKADFTTTSEGFSATSAVSGGGSVTSSAFKAASAASSASGGGAVLVAGV